jgi:hypothetical protein
MLSLRSRLFLKVTIRHSMQRDLPERDTKLAAIKETVHQVASNERIIFDDIGHCLTQS